MRKGVVELCVLTLLDETEHYGYQIVQRLQAIGPLALSESTVYPVLARLAGDGAIAVRVEPSPSGPPRRWYRLTAEGREQLRLMTNDWHELARGVTDLIKQTRTARRTP
ncbi:MAG TPA: PadR family transcriptional regulator [Planctomycetota bacterium]|nr:PadR family transcriptional regulator [Planctomycetota bacterium]